MTWIRGLRPNSWWLENMSIGGLLVAIAVAGFVALGINYRVSDVLVRALQFDLEIEGRTDSLRVAVLNLRNYHRNLIFEGPTPRRVKELESAYQQLLVRIDEMGQLEIEDQNLPHASELRDVAERYYAIFRPTIDSYETDREAFDLASDDGLWLLVELETDARKIARFGERHASTAVQGVEDATNTAHIMLIANLVGHICIGAGLAYIIMRHLREQRQAAANISLALQQKTEFIADMSHELRTPLTVLRANAEVALELDRTCVHADLLEEIVDESKHMTRLVNDLILLARSDSQQMPLEWELVETAPFMLELSERARGLASLYNVGYEADLAAEGLIQIDRPRISQAVLILVDNAAKYGSSGKQITLRSAVRGPEIMIEVEDHGPGISEENLAKIFERFYRVDKTRTRNVNSSGLGLGLAIAKTIIDMHGGRIEAESKVHVGTRMRLFLPIVQQIETPKATSEPALIIDARA